MAKSGISHFDGMLCDLVRAEEGRLAVVEPCQHGASLAGEEAVAEDGGLVGEAGGPPH